MEHRLWTDENKKSDEKLLRAGCLGAETYLDRYGELPEDLTVSDLHLTPGYDADVLELEKLPRGLTVRGSMMMHDTKIRELPDDIRIERENLTILRSPLEDAGN